MCRLAGDEGASKPGVCPPSRRLEISLAALEAGSLAQWRTARSPAQSRDQHHWKIDARRPLASQLGERVSEN